MPKSKEPNDEVGDKHNDSNTNTFANLESVSNKGDKNRSAPSEQDMVDILPIVYLPVRPVGTIKLILMPLQHLAVQVKQINEKVTPSDIQHSAATQIWGCYRLVSEPGYREPAVMSSASSAVTYTSVYTDSEPGRVFWGADEEISDGGSPRVIVLGYDGLPIQPVAPPSPDYIHDSEEPQTPPVPQDEDEREPMVIEPHDPDYVLEPIYPEYIPLEDEHEFPVEEQPLPPVDSPTAESPGYVVESDPEEDPEEYEDDETEDGPVDYPMDRGVSSCTTYTFNDVGRIIRIKSLLDVVWITVTHVCVIAAQLKLVLLVNISAANELQRKYAK
ncbi:hypothetical protein Tco_0952555 [Tanacetum coccineum]|uniref:Uncharacterized protein n=1 Tax=Tanacetum coccineum TaxID=301880 RepID=A0ABQ5DXP4_9ASTR